MSVRRDPLSSLRAAALRRWLIGGLRRLSRRIRGCSVKFGSRGAEGAGLAAIFFFPGVISAAIVTIDFETGADSPGQAIGDAYASQGVLFSNAAWITAVSTENYSGVFFSGQAGLGALEGCQTLATWAFPCESSPIRALFPLGVTWVSVEAYDVGENGARLRAFDAAGQQVGPDQTVVGEGYGVGNGPLVLTATGTDIRSVALDEPYYYKNNGFQDGIGFDNLRFEPRPVLTIRELGPAQIQLSWDSATNLAYQVEFLPSLTSKQWSPVGQSVVGTGTNVSVTATVVPGQSAGFYRLVAYHAP